LSRSSVARELVVEEGSPESAAMGILGRAHVAAEENLAYHLAASK
jgi:hypothetical protein